ncbi:MAG: acylphosphatase [Dermatophilus congolensis]|nr:acylphosphatase [Dermatophilus congolensis]
MSEQPLQPDSGAPAKATFFVTGTVQGVGFRWWVKSKGLELGLVGFARNLDDRRVEVCAQGEREAVERLGEMLTEKVSSHRRPGRVRHVVTQWGTPRTDLVGFREL